MCDGLKVILLFICWLEIGNAAFAHMPYVIKQHHVVTESGQPLVVERFGGDGVFWPDPTALQIRNAQAGLLGR